MLFRKYSLIYLNSTYIKWCPKHDCIITQSTAPGRFMSVARKTMSSPCNVVIDLWTCIKWDITCSSAPCHLQDAPGHGQEYGLYSQASSWSAFCVWSNEATQPEIFNSKNELMRFPSFFFNFEWLFYLTAGICKETWQLRQPFPWQGFWYFPPIGLDMLGSK